MSTDESTALRRPEQTPDDPAATPSRGRSLIIKARSAGSRGRDAVPRKIQRAGRTVGDNWVPAAAGVTAVAAAATVLVLRRKRVARLRAAGNRWRPGFLRR